MTIVFLIFALSIVLFIASEKAFNMGNEKLSWRLIIAWMWCVLIGASALFIDIAGRIFMMIGD